MPALRISYSLILFVLATSSYATLVAADTQSDLTTLRTHLVDHLTRDVPSDSEVRRYVTTLQADGSWPDVDYADRQRGGWQTYGHMARVLELARAYHSVGHAHRHSAVVREAIVRSLNHWLKHRLSELELVVRSDWRAKTSGADVNPHGW